MYEVEMNAHPLANKFEFDKLSSLTRVVDASGKIELVVEGDEITGEGFEGPYDVYVLLTDQGEEYIDRHDDLLNRLQDASVADNMGYAVINDVLVPTAFIAVPRGTEF